jgi:amidophosphoribosyltransferase
MSGLFGIAASGDVFESLFYGTDYHSHLGTEYGGLAVWNGESFARRIHSIGDSQFKSKFNEEAQRLQGRRGIGVISDSDEQPIYLNSRFGPFCLATSGYIENAETLTADLLARGVTFSEMGSGKVNRIELVAKLIASGHSLVDGIQKMFDAIEGSCSLLLLHRDGIYAARDRRGYTPLTIGQRGDAWAVTAETTAFPNLDFKPVKYLAPGEIVLVNEQDGLVAKAPGNPDQQICAFLWIYTGFPASTYEGVNVEVVRERCGRFLARQDQGLEVDQVSGVPDSGLAHGLGYAMESGVPFRRPLVKYTPGYGRSYTPPTQAKRDLIAKMKLVGIADIIRGQRIVLCEDSIVRGTQLKNFAIQKLWEHGAREVHVRPACPPLMFPCRFILSTRSLHELAARRAIRALEGRDPEDVSAYLDHRTPAYQKMVDWIAKDLRVTSLKYLTPEDMVRAIGLPRERLCLHCWTGQCPGACGSQKAVATAPAKAMEAN